MTQYPAYFRDVSHLDAIDIYRVLAMWQIDSPALQHAIKKLMAAGKRGAKDDAKDVQEAIDSLQRWQQMRAEDAGMGDEPPRLPADITGCGGELA